MSVLVVGGGPVGLTLALSLAHYGVDCLVLEKAGQPSVLPRLDIVNARSMEIFRSLDLHRELVGASPTAGASFDVLWATSPKGREIHRFRYPPRSWWRALSLLANDGCFPAEEGLRMSVSTLEGVLLKAVEQSPCIEFLRHAEVVDVWQDKHGVGARLADGRELKADWLVGCDGAGSLVRQIAGIELHVLSEVGPIQSVRLRTSPDENMSAGGDPAWHVQSNRGTLVSDDGKQLFTLHMPTTGETEKQVPWRQQMADFLGSEVDCEVLSHGLWHARQAVAGCMRSERILLAGDSAHQYVPTGGYGFNSGVGDAWSLAWRLAGCLQGWAATGELDRYDRERRRACWMNQGACSRHLATRASIASAWRRVGEAALEAEGRSGKHARAVLQQWIKEVGNAENELWGLEAGDLRPLVSESDDLAAEVDGQALAEYVSACPVEQLLRFSPAVVPGARLAHFFLKDGTALLDHLKPCFNLVVVRGADEELKQIQETIGTSEQGVSDSLIDLRLLWPSDKVDWAVDWLRVRPDGIIQASGTMAEAAKLC